MRSVCFADWFSAGTINSHRTIRKVQEDAVPLWECRYLRRSIIAGVLILPLPELSADGPKLDHENREKGLGDRTLLLLHSHNVGVWERDHDEFHVGEDNGR